MTDIQRRESAMPLTFLWLIPRASSLPGGPPPLELAGEINDYRYRPNESITAHNDGDRWH